MDWKVWHQLVERRTFTTIYKLYWINVYKMNINVKTKLWLCIQSWFLSILFQFVCTEEGCEKTFNAAWKLRTHMQKHTDLEKLVNKIKNNYFSKYVFVILNKFTFQYNKYVCPQDGCGKRFITPSKMRRHQVVHDDSAKTVSFHKRTPSVSLINIF